MLVGIRSKRISLVLRESRLASVLCGQAISVATFSKLEGYRFKDMAVKIKLEYYAESVS